MCHHLIFGLAWFLLVEIPDLTNVKWYRWVIRLDSYMVINAYLDISNRTTEWGIIHKGLYTRRQTYHGKNGLESNSNQFATLVIYNAHVFQVYVSVEAEELKICIQVISWKCSVRKWFRECKCTSAQYHCFDYYTRLPTTNLVNTGEVRQVKKFLMHWTAAIL